jgi:hypothetical protein
MGSSSNDWIYQHFGYTLSLNYSQTQAIQRHRSFTHFKIHCCTHTSPLLITQLKHRNHKSLTESHTPNIKVFTSHLKTSQDATHEMN